MEAYCRHVLRQLEEPAAPGDPIERCQLKVKARISKDATALLELADKELHVFPFDKVDLCWRRLYTDASIARAATLVLEHEAGDHDGRGPAWLDEAVRMLDMALIMTGAFQREDMAHDFMTKLNEMYGSMSKDQAIAEEEQTFGCSTARLPELSCPIPRLRLDLPDFQHHLRRATPLVLLGSMDAWPALHERPWKDPKYLLSRTFGGMRLVPVELGRAYTDDEWSQKIMTFKDYMQDFLLSEQPENIGYLAQHDLFMQIPALRNDICIPDLCFTSPPPPAPGTPLHGKEPKVTEDPQVNAWLGPAGTISPLHTDPYHNILCQVVGKKYVRLYPPEQSKKLYPRGLEGQGIDMSNTSRLPVEDVEMGCIVDDDSQFPLFAEAEYVETVLSEGECLYIPIGWWHYVRSLTTSFSVSFWWN